MSNIFDDLSGAAGKDLADPTTATTASEHAAESGTDLTIATPRNIKQVTQELLKFGLLEADRKPALYQLLITHQDRINAALEPLDLTVKVDDVRGLGFISVVADPFTTPATTAAAAEDEGAHPLVRRQRLTLEQSLLVAILRQAYLAHEQEAGTGAGQALIAVDELLSQFELFMGSSGSEARDEKRVRNLLENIRSHGVVSEIDDKDQVTIRPIITHLANPESLQALLNDFRQAAEPGDGDVTMEEPST